MSGRKRETVSGRPSEESESEEDLDTSLKLTRGGWRTGYETVGLSSAYTCVKSHPLIFNISSPLVPGRQSEKAGVNRLYAKFIGI